MMANDEDIDEILTMRMMMIMVTIIIIYHCFLYSGLVLVIGAVGGVLAALLITAIIWCILKHKKAIAQKLSKKKPLRKDYLMNGSLGNQAEKKSQTIYFPTPTRSDLDQCLVPSDPMKYFPQTDYCSVTDVDPDLYK